MSEVEQILLSGSDPRLSVDPLTGLNRFGCTPAPRPGTLSFGSSTASSISAQAYTHVRTEYQSLKGKHDKDATMETVRRELTHLLELTGTGTEIVFSPSGTDSVLHALFLVRALSGGAPLDCILTASEETGSGVPLALSGRHFGDRTAEGVCVTPGAAIAGLSGGVRLISIPRRHPASGMLRPPACLDQDIWEAVECAVDAGRQVLLQVMDCSKMGAACPSTECRRRLASRFAGSVHFVVDACQMRLSRTRLREYLAQGHLVLISGSKFFTGPPFSGALLVPAGHAARLAEAEFAAGDLDTSGLQDYTSRAAWPTCWPAIRDALPERSCLGQQMRWSAALSEMRAYFAVSPAFRQQSLDQFAAMTTAQIRNHPSDFLLLEDHRDTASEPRTIFPFLVRSGSAWLSYTQTVAVYHALNRDMTQELPPSLSAPQKALAATLCHLGQPVRIPLQDGNDEGKDAGAIRLSADARMVSQLWTQHQTSSRAAGLASLEQQVCTILAKTALIARQIQHLQL